MARAAAVAAAAAAGLRELRAAAPPAERVLPGDPAAWFPDYDCVRAGGRGTQPPVAAWDQWLARLEEGERLSEDLVKLSLRELPVLAMGDVRAQASEECAAGLLMSDVLHAVFCHGRASSSTAPPPEAEACYDSFGALARRGLAALGLRVLIGSRWPIARVLASHRWGSAESAEGGAAGAAAAGAAEAGAAEAGSEVAQQDLGCESFARPVLDWAGFKGVFAQNNWYQGAVDVAYGPELERGWREAALECPLGFTVANLIKAMLCAHTESICFRAHAVMIEDVLSDIPLHAVASSGWPVLRLIFHLTEAVRRHHFKLDFEPAELLEDPSAPPAPAAGGSAARASRAMRELRAALPSLRQAAARHCELPGARALGLRIVYATMAYGASFSPYVGRFVSRARALGIDGNLVIFCLDEEAYGQCVEAAAHCIHGEPSILNKFTLPLVLLADGLDVMWLDLDVFLFKSPTPYVLRDLELAEGRLELLVSGSFAVDCVCSGIVFFRAASRTRRWLAHLLSWMYRHPYEHDQKAFSAFLRAGERVAFEEDLPVPAAETPAWAFLDPETEFVSARHVDAAGWSGDPDRIVAFHLLHGDSDDAPASHQFAQRFGLGAGYLPLMDMFFNQTGLPELYSTAALPHRVSDVLREAMWLSRWPHPRPAVPGRCNETVPMRY